MNYQLYTSTYIMNKFTLKKPDRLQHKQVVHDKDVRVSKASHNTSTQTCTNCNNHKLGHEPIKLWHFIVYL